MGKGQPGAVGGGQLREAAWVGECPTPGRVWAAGRSPYKDHAEATAAAVRAHLVQPFEMASNKTVKTSDEILCEGELEKRSDSLFQVWKKKRCVLTADRLRLFSGNSGRAKELCFNTILKVDCVEHTSKYVYFTIVTNFYKEIDFRCTGRSCWNAAITMALIDFQNRRALEDFRRYRYPRSESETQSEAESGELWVRETHRTS
ncbi:pleckstrin homology-like domain family A member 2 [Arvicanthis niloticus]|uniref:pleckstrin homology-like domain family A member 2 n=1 Tax=Arvicanthis niloticus TaxID=61156 RepID=UPI001486D7BB|nr:pleckstrin homology-like domain family A member 2 [Arvicanthis niloticus]